MKNDIVEFPTVEDAKRMVAGSDIRFMKGQPYNIYSCGCIIKHADDPLKFMAGGVNKINRRCCPVHPREGEFIVKFYICKNCGAKHYLKRVHATDKCVACRVGGYKQRPPSKFHNARFADENRRATCLHRSSCLEKFIRYQAVPCRGCKDYIYLDIMDDAGIQGGYGHLAT